MAERPRIYHPEHHDRELTIGWLVAKAITSHYVTDDEVNELYVIREALNFIKDRVVQNGDDWHEVLAKWGVLDQALEYLNKTE